MDDQIYEVCAKSKDGKTMAMEIVILTENVTENDLQSKIEPPIEENKRLKLEIEQAPSNFVETNSRSTKQLENPIVKPEKKIRQRKRGTNREETKTKVAQNGSVDKKHTLGKNILQNGKILPIKLTKCREIITKPKYPPSSFTMWARDEFPKLKSTGKGVLELWKLMPEKDRNVWKEKAAAAKEQYFKDRETYIRLSYERDKKEYNCKDGCRCIEAVLQ